jgi:uncharacterized protein
MLSLFIAGLSGSLTHCLGMCSPFVLSQVSARMEATPAHTMREWHRLSGAALLPYHLGRSTTYAMLGACGALLTESLKHSAFFHHLAQFLLLLAAFMFLHASGFLHGSYLNKIKVIPRFVNIISKLSKPLSSKPTGFRGYFLGFLLGFLPCGLLYGAIAVASSTGEPLTAALAMLSFSLGTIPALVLVAFGVNTLLKQKQQHFRRIFRWVMLLNALILCSIAFLKW